MVHGFLTTFCNFHASPNHLGSPNHIQCTRPSPCPLHAFTLLSFAAHGVPSCSAPAYLARTMAYMGADAIQGRQPQCRCW